VNLVDRWWLRRRYVFVVAGIAAIVALAFASPRARLANLLRSSETQAPHVAGASSTPVHVSFTYNGETRTYWLYKPTSVKTSPALVLELPGQGFPNEGVPYWEQLSDQDGFLVAFPEPKSNWGDPAEKAYVGGVIDDVVAKQKADRTRVYLTGGSAGGTEAYAVACSPTGAKVAGVGGIFAAVVTPTPGPAGIEQACNPPHPLTIVEVHGTGDSFVPYNGRACQVSKDTGRTVCLPSQLELMQFWAKLDGCDPTPASTTSGKLRIDVWSSCSAGTGVELNSVAGADHNIQAVTVNGVSPYARIWSFLKAHGAAPVTLRGSIVSGRVVGRGAKRKLVVVVDVNAPYTARVTLKRGSTIAASKAFARPAGKTTLMLAVRPAAKRATYVLGVSVRTSLGQLALRRTVKVPS
jgi:polyhydroxybutyrate depolymerase